jgi:hypothetical protein
MKTVKNIAFALISFVFFNNQAWGQESSATHGAAEVPLKKVSLYSSGVGFFEHIGVVDGNAAIALPFNINGINDALKSLVIREEGGASTGAAPQVNYPSENTYWKTLQSLKIDVSGNRGIAEILQSLKGAEVSITTPAQVLLPVPVTGRIVNAEAREYIQPQNGGKTAELTVTLSTSSGLSVIPLKDIRHISFKDKEIEADLNRALNLIGSYNEGGSRDLLINAPGSGRRNVNISYVIPAPVWKVSYRLDLSSGEPFLQGWAIVDNDGDIDWDGVELSLVTGRQASFIQNLYEPYYQNRPNVPLNIAGAAEARVYEDGYSYEQGAAPVAENFALRKSANDSTGAPEGRALFAQAAPQMAERAQADSAAYGFIGGGGRTGRAAPQAEGRAAGDQFEYRFQKPVSLPRRQSAMLPIIEAPVAIKKTLIFSGSNGRADGSISNPQISAELTNNTGMKLPAGPITVFDGGAYAGDALLNFFPEGEKRYISFGDDLSVSGSSNTASSRFVQSVRAAGGILYFNRSLRRVCTYTLLNGSSEAKEIVIEHPITRGAALSEPEKAESQTLNHYRFERALPASGQLTFSVVEETPIEETVMLARLGVDALVSYSSNQELPQNVRDAFAEALALRRAAEKETTSLAQAQERYTRLTAEQERIRKNLEAAGRETQAGKDYLSRIAALDGEIDACVKQSEEAKERAQAEKEKYEDFIKNLEL